MLNIQANAAIAAVNQDEVQEAGPIFTPQSTDNFSWTEVVTVGMVQTHPFRRWATTNFQSRSQQKSSSRHPIIGTVLYVALT
jgi:hypothetical protein